jgi:hypothetical protein
MRGKFICLVQPSKIKISMEHGQANKPTKHTVSFVNCMSGDWFCPAWPTSTQPGYEVCMNALQETIKSMRAKTLIIKGKAIVDS